MQRPSFAYTSCSVWAQRVRLGKQLAGCIYGGSPQENSRTRGQQNHIPQLDQVTTLNKWVSHHVVSLPARINQFSDKHLDVMGRTCRDTFSTRTHHVAHPAIFQLAVIVRGGCFKPGQHLGSQIIQSGSCTIQQQGARNLLASYGRRVQQCPLPCSRG